MTNALIKKTVKRIISISGSLMLLLILCSGFGETVHAANVVKQYTIAAWEFTEIESSDMFWATHGMLKHGSYMYAHTDREMTTSKTSIDGGTFLGTVYCGDWGPRGNLWGIHVSTEGYKNVTLTFASYGVAGAPRDFRVETETGEVLARFTSGTAATTGKYTRVNISLPSSCNDRNYILIYIVQEGNISVNGGTVRPGNVSNSRLGDIIVSGEKIDEELHGSVIAAWEFTNVVSSSSFQATDGSLANSANILAQTGRTATTSRVSVSNRRFLGTIYSGGWNDGACWEINFSTEGYGNIALSFASYGVNGAPHNFRVEDTTGNILARFDSGTSAADATYLDLMLPDYFDNGGGSIYIYMEGTASVGGGTVQPGNASNSRLGDIVISGVKLSDQGGGEPGSELTLRVQKDAQYIFSVRGKDIVNFSETTFAITYDPSIWEPIDLCAFTWESELSEGMIMGSNITIILYRPGEIVFTADKAILTDAAWSGVLNAICFRAISTGDTTISVGLNPNSL